MNPLAGSCDRSQRLACSIERFEEYKGELQTKHHEALANTETKILESSVIDADWESINTDFDMSFEPNDWLALEGEVEVKSLPSTHEDNPFNSDDLPE